MEFRCQYQDSYGQRCNERTHDKHPYCRWHLTAQRVTEYSQQWPFKWTAEQGGRVIFIFAFYIALIYLLTILILIYHDRLPAWMSWGGTMTPEVQLLFFTAQGLPLILLFIPLCLAQRNMLCKSIRTVWPKTYVFTLIVLIGIFPYTFWAPRIFGYAGQLATPIYTKTWYVSIISLCFMLVPLNALLNALLINSKSYMPHLLMGPFMAAFSLGGIGIILLLIVMGLWYDAEFKWIEAARKRLDV